MSCPSLIEHYAALEDPRQSWAIAVVEAEVERNGGISLERRYYLSSMPLDARLFACASGYYWHVENRLHWVLDVVFHEDLSRLRFVTGPQNMATVRHMAVTLR